MAESEIALIRFIAACPESVSGSSFRLQSDGTGSQNEAAICQTLAKPVFEGCQILAAPGGREWIRSGGRKSKEQVTPRCDEPMQ
ncbi:MAG: hypothetical protein HQ518_01090 [Rhodopirellula sp.]|nr:hypothetical protein [Rhodopirellula sp.]